MIILKSQEAPPVNKPTTDELFKQLKKTSTVSALEKYTQEIMAHCPAQSFPEYLNHCLNISGLTPAQLIRDAQIQRNYGYQILNGTRNPGRNRIIALCLALSLSLEDTQRALTLAGEGILYPKSPRDSILIFSINKKLSVADTNLLLDSKGEKML